MTMESLIVTLVIGAIAGWLAARVLKKTGFGLIGDIIVGVIGGYIGTWLWDVLHLPPIGGPWVVSAIVTSTVGAIVLLVLLRLIRS
ncbi:MAG TPA: GlsB/YeaQ/YmgE family stress response membrane protein [Xanthobacteraceae bacterium]|nr:GlsB/YeaQ/YmgE family stress response membrane protein [Xanthobacteraceae bacterium]